LVEIVRVERLSEAGEIPVDEGSCFRIRKLNWSHARSRLLYDRREYDPDSLPHSQVTKITNLIEKVGFREDKGNSACPIEPEVKCMPCLSNARQERFCQGLAAGKTIDQAYREAGYAAHRGNASTLRSKQHIQARVAELQSCAAERAVLSRQWVIEGLIEIVERSMQLKAVLCKGRVIAFRSEPAAAIRALELLGKELGMFTGRVEADQNLRIISAEPLTETQWEERYANGGPRTH
jgi:phage terminase small subunit